MTGSLNWKILYCEDGYVNVGNDKKDSDNWNSIRWYEKVWVFLPVNVGEKKLKNDALNSIKGLSTTHCCVFYLEPDFFSAKMMVAFFHFFHRILNFFSLSWLGIMTISEEKEHR